MNEGRTMTTPQTPWLLTLKPPGTAGEAPPPPHDQPKGALPADTLGLALSGGGIRSAAFCLGVLQSLARSGWLRHVDYLSTVSGGGYVGAFLGRFFDLCGKPDGLGGALPNETSGAGQDRVARELADSRSAPVEWLRRNANYLSPTGLGEAAANVAGFFRNLISVYLVLAVFLFALFGVLDAVGYADLPRSSAASLFMELVRDLTPIRSLLPQTWAGVWTGLAELVLWLAVVPLMLGYWLVSQDVPEAFVAPVLISAAVLAVALSLATSSVLGLAVLAAGVFWALEAWANVRRREDHADPLNRFRLLLARNHLTRLLTFWVAVAFALAGLALVDGAGRWLARALTEAGMLADRVAAWLGSAAAIVVALASVLRMAMRFLVPRMEERAGLLGTARPYLWGALVVVLGALPPLVAVSFAAQVAYANGEEYRQGLIATAVAVVVSLLLGSRDAVPFINRSGPLSIYAARLARAFLGAINPQRRTHPEGRNITHLVPGDDVPFAHYDPQIAGGPLHLINCAVNETVDVASSRGLRDRQAENMAVGPAGVNVAQRYHGLWVGRKKEARAALLPLGVREPEPHPFRTRTGGPVAVEPLDLREWAAISGATLSPGLGRRTSLARALLLTLTNLRLGYWWNSGLSAQERPDVPLRGGLLPTILDFAARWFRTQILLLSEALGRFGGPWYRYWYLSDGGNFENTGAYELLRRRVPFLIVCDAGEDPAHHGTNLATLVRLARVDFGAEVEAVGDLGALGVPPQVAARLGTLDDLLPTIAGALPTRHAVLLLVRYPRLQRGPSGDAWTDRGHTWLLYLKSSRTGDESADVRNYAERHPDFPDEPTLEQMFDEPQWESYRKLGEHVADGVLGSA
jgi:hypothetical protein